MAIPFFFFKCLKNVRLKLIFGVGNNHRNGKKRFVLDALRLVMPLLAFRLPLTLLADAAESENKH